MRRRLWAAIALVAAAPLLAGCGSGGSTSTATVQASSKRTTASEVHEMVTRLEGDEQFEARYAARARHCRAEHSRREYRAACVRPFAGELHRRYRSEEAFIYRQFREVGEGCRKAIERGEPYDPLEDRTLAACEQDIGE